MRIKGFEDSCLVEVVLHLGCDEQVVLLLLLIPIPALQPCSVAAHEAAIAGGAVAIGIDPAAAIHGAQTIDELICVYWRGVVASIVLS